MKPITGSIIAFALLVGAASSYASATDTTYGAVQAVNKENKPPAPQQPAAEKQCHRHNDDDDVDTGSLSSQLAGCLFKGIGMGLYYVYISPIVKIAGGDRQVTNSQNGNHVSIELGNGFILYPGIAAGLQLEANISDLYRCGSLGFRVATGLKPAFMGIYKDFQRTVFVNSSLIGTQRDATGGYFNFQIPLEGFLHWFPTGDRGAFHLYLGGGTAYVYESLDALRTATFNSTSETIHLKRWTLVPVGTAGIGRMVEGQSVMGNFSVDYSLSLNPYTRQVSFPVDNTKYAHIISLRWALIF